MQLYVGWLHWIWLLEILYIFYKLLTDLLFFFFSPTAVSSIFHGNCSFLLFVSISQKQTTDYFFKMFLITLMIALIFKWNRSLMLLKFLLCISNQQNFRLTMRKWSLKRSALDIETYPSVKCFPFPEKQNGRWILLNSES